MYKAQNAMAGREAMKHSTKVIHLDGSRALRSKTSNAVADFLNVCSVEQRSQAGADDMRVRRTVRQEEEHRWYTDQIRQISHTRDSDSDAGEESEAVRTQDQTQTREQDVQTEVRQTEDEPDTPKQKGEIQRAPIFASFAGMDLLGMGLRRTFKADKCVGGSEWTL